MHSAFRRGRERCLIDTAIMVEELYAVNASVTLTLIGTVLGLLPLLVGGTKEQRGHLLPPFLKRAAAPLAGFCATEPGGSANAASPPPGEGVRTTARLSGDRWIIYALADAKMAIEAARYLCWRACRAVDLQSPGAEELAIEAKVFGSETAVRVLTELMRVVGIESYDALPLARLLQDALALPLFGGGNIGVRRRRLHAILQRPEYDPLAASSEVQV